MRLVIQRVHSASVKSDGVLTGQIDTGLVVLVGVMEGDTKTQAKYLADKTAALRIFSDENDKMNLSVQDVKGSILAISNFTLGGDCKKGNRPSFVRAEKPHAANELYEWYIKMLREKGIKVATGVFGAHMDIDIQANGPITIWMDTDEMGR